MKKNLILCVDDEKIILNSLEDQIMNWFKGRVEIELAEGGEEGLEILEDLRAEGREVSVIICDQLMPGIKGDEFMVAAHRMMPDTVNILLTGQTSLDAVRRVINEANLYRYLIKPWDEDDLMLTIEKALASYNQGQALTESNVYTRLLRTLNRQAREISSEIKTDQLIDKFLSIALECTEAQRGVLILRQGADYRIVAMSGSGNVQANRLQQFTQTEIDLLTSHFMENIDLLLGEHTHDTRQMAARIEYLNQNYGFIYLEVVKGQHQFNAHHREMLDMLASQAAISIENARLYGEIEHNAQALKLEKEVVENVKSQLEEVNEDLTDSIRYAQRIQNAFLPPVESLSEFLPDSFVLIRPRDIVSGDFYWWHHSSDCTILAAVDCTGHGVPGALMSVIGANFLNQIVSEYAIFDPEVILNYLDIRVQGALGKSRAEHAQRPAYDGMDLALCVLEHDSRQLKFAGANRPLIVVRNGVLTELQGTKRSIGHNPIETAHLAFETYNWALEPGDCIYLFSDGYPDQFGGDQHKKFSIRRFKEILTQLHTHPMAEQGMLLNLLLDDWRKNNRQTDDILVLGFRW
jgi:serine phosphatase RsbU (regulator of sigma subunit)/FixJ family two-component response regulator